MSVKEFPTIKLKYLAHIEMGQSPPSDEYVLTAEEGLPFLQGTADFTDLYPKPRIYCPTAPKLAKPGDILFSVRAPVGELNLADQVYGIGRGLCAVRIGYQLDMRYAWWALHGVRHRLNALATGSTYEAVAVEDISNLEIPLPPLRQQQHLAALLDRETARLDQLVAAKQEQLDLIAEKRRALITRAVTQGLDDAAPRRETGLPWLGQVPVGWKVVRLKYLAAVPLDYGANEAADEDNPTFPRFIRITDIDEDGKLRTDTFASLAPNLAAPYLLSEGDILLARSGATVGKTFIYCANMGPACFAGYLIRLRPRRTEVVPDFLYNFSLSDAYWAQIREGAIQSTIQNFSAEKYAEMTVALPGLAEQKAILAYIEAETDKLDTLRGITETSLSLMHERRAALIAAAVTGELDVTTT